MTDRNMSPDEVRNGYMSTMGENLGLHFYHLSDELTWATWVWDEYLELFTKSESRCALQNESANFFFGVVQNTFWQHVVLCISRMTDPEESCGKHNLSLDRLVQCVDDAQFRVQLTPQLDSVKNKCGFVRDLRNRRLAHNDLALFLSPDSGPQPVATVAMITEALEAIGSILNAIEYRHSQSTTSYDLIAKTGSAVDLLYRLRDARRMEAKRQSDIAEKRYNPQDWGDGEDPL
jgi:hypothetical protein